MFPKKTRHYNYHAVVPLFFIHIKRKVCKACVNQNIQIQKVIVALGVFGLSHYLAMADEQDFYHKTPSLSFGGIIAQTADDCNAPKAPLCKGGWIFAVQKDWGFVTIPPARLTPCHLPLHKGGFSVGKSYASIVDDEKTTFEQ